MKLTSNIASQITAEIGKIGHNRSYHFISEGRWSMHQLLVFLLNITGPADVMLSTFSISEVAIRTLVSLRKDGLIENLQCLFDQGLPKRKLDLIFFANKVIDRISLYKNHSKIMVITNKDWQIAVNASANFTPNIRIEAGIVTTEPDHVRFYKQRLTELINKGIPLQLC